MHLAYMRRGGRGPAAQPRRVCQQRAAVACRRHVQKRHVRPGPCWVEL